MASVPDAMATGKEYGVLVIPGTEISVVADGEEHIHILAYFAPGTESTELEDQLEALREARYARGKKMLEKLAGLESICNGREFWTFQEKLLPEDPM